MLVGVHGRPGISGAFADNLGVHRRGHAGGGEKVHGCGAQIRNAWLPLEFVAADKRFFPLPVLEVVGGFLPYPICHSPPGGVTHRGSFGEDLFHPRVRGERLALTDAYRCPEAQGGRIDRYPFRFWRDSDAPDRQGITEIRHVEGLYALWDELLRRHPGLIIDNANWRGTGPDLEMLMRSAGSWTCSEAARGGENRVYNQAQLAGLSLYVPIHASLLWGTDPYTVRSVARFGTSIAYDTRPVGFARQEMKQASEEIRALRPLYLGDYYPLTVVDLDERHWCGWQFDRPDLGQGFAMFFRRPASLDAVCEAHLRAVDPSARYELTLAETYQVKERRLVSGRPLASIRVEIRQAPGSLLVRYARQGRNGSSRL